MSGRCLALGEVEVKLNENEPAAQTMEALLRQDSSSWRAHLIAAAAYAQIQNYSKRNSTQNAQ